MRVGRAVGRRLSGFEVALLATDPRGVADSNVKGVTMSELLSRSDVVSLHAPLSESTRD